ncbi:S8 family serine peptidase [Spirilliplanes yamanashiensis]|uniref:Serine protease n=1 Tax=Spirilliplanes yamanashiensis TaxID=42233 RepID=A0A8J4DJ93_9ACTN|nr:S8 family serine peptidase [Spirilliplanes yamanashiensis]MDP9815688.1 subtilisin family serine protease [Spirilliplanes yamanashiensis]GIJ03942.1 serine protease [Spirilliplanes yamanashiensis]
MTLRRGALAALVTAGFLVAPAAPAAAGPAPAPAAPASTTAAPAGAGVTLVTGDRVRLAGDRVVVEPAKGRERIGFARWTSRGDTYVVPADALALTGAGRVDRRLFNITQLVAHGFDDRSRADLPLVVTTSRPSAVPGVTRAFPRAGAAAVRTRKADAPRLWSTVRAGGAVQRLALDGPVRAQLDRSVTQIGAPVAWRAGLTGKGVTVAVVDSGVDARHPDLADAVADAVDLSGDGTGDAYGHGTHVASILAGSGAARGGEYRGVAPDARLLDVKVLGDDGSGSESGILAGLEYAATHGADVVNVSLGIDFSADGADVLSAAVDRLTERTGALFVVAAGNNGPTAGTIGSPAAAASALTVGAVDRDDSLAWFSARGPRHHNSGIKPDLTAPGVGIVAALTGAGGTDGPYTAMSGTSMAAPHVAGAAALLAQAHPGWSAAQLKAALMGTAVPSPGATVYEQGAGRADLARATAQRVFASAASIDVGVAAWPHADDAPVRRPVTFTNTGDAPATVDLAFDVRDPAGAPAPAGMFAADPPRLTVPAGGSATATVIVDTRDPEAPTGVYGGVLTAAGLRIPVGVDVEAERYDVAVQVRGRRGEATADYGLRLTNLDTLAEYTPYAPSGRVVARVPHGRYRLDTFVRSGAETVIGIEPELVVDRDRAVTVSGADGHTVDLRVERPGARVGTAWLGFDSVSTGGVPLGYGWIGGQEAFGSVYVRPSETAAPGRFTFTAEASLAQPSHDGAFRDSPYLYNVRAVTDGRVPAGVARVFADAELARVDATLAAAAPGRTGVRGIVERDLPATLTEFYTPGHVWYPDFAQYGPRGREHLTAAPARVYAAGQVTRETWNGAVFGPSLPVRPGRLFLAERVGDQISVGVPMFADGAVDHTGHPGAVRSQSTELYAGDRLVGTYPLAGQGYFPVPSTPGEYRLRSELTQAGADTSTSVTADWTFSSAPAPGVTNVPLLAVRFAPVLDGRNAAPGGAFSFAAAVQRNGDGIVGAGVTLAVDASTDDGATWAPAALARTGDGWTVTVTHPAGAAFVSLRATARDTAGNAVTQTILRAYAVR